MSQHSNVDIKNFQHIHPTFSAAMYRRLELFSIQVSSQYFIIALSLVFVLLFNKSFLVNAWHIQSINSLGVVLFDLSLVLVLWLSILFLLSLVCIRGIIKPVSIFLLISGSCAAHFMDTYGIIVDKEMLRNAWQTDIQETTGLVNIHLIEYVVVIGILPALVVAKTKIIWKPFWPELTGRIVTTIASLLISLALILSLSNYYSSFFRNHKEVRFLANPLGLVNAGTSLLHESYQRPQSVEPISHGAKLGPGTLNQSKPVLVVFVVGETARAANFALNGYSRDTTPLLARKDIIYFNNFYSCGTSTAVSLPCMFSSLSRSDYSDSKARSRHGLLDFINTAGINVLWRDNNSGCKGTCDRVISESSEEVAAKEWCKEGSCYDEVLLTDLAKKVSRGNQFIVLHQKGSHGPAYSQRYPDSMQFYSPVCKTNQLQNCSREEVVNAYDNTIRYTDYFLNKVIDWLMIQQDSHNAVMVYVSDHGESLGEQNLYLHGLPYAFAPEFQKHIPFIFWASPDFYHDRGLKKECLLKSISQKFSHDNIFHSFLGLLDIETNYYQSELDLFSRCIGQP